MPGTAKVGAISKPQNCKRGPFGLCETSVGYKIWKKIKGDPREILKNFRNKLKMKFLNSVTVPKNVKGHFLTSIVLQNIETNEGETLWWNPKKSHSAEKN